MNADPKNQNASEPEVIDVEEYAKTGRPVPPGKKYKIRIDRAPYTVTMPKLTGRQILAEAGKTPETHLLHQRLRGGVTRTVEANDSVDLTGDGPERFMTMIRETQEGFAEGRRQFRLSTADESFLNSRFPGWEAVKEGDTQWVIIRNYVLPTGYSALTTNVAIQLVAGYPDAGLDMAYFTPALQRTGGQAIPAITPHTLDGRDWQRWSRHRTAANPWVPGEDSLATHLSYIEFFLAEECRRRP